MSLNYKETFYFVAKCLTICYEEKNRQEIDKHLKTNAVDWDSVVKLSTAHHVFTALYCNLMRADFLHYLPKDLVVYMSDITDLNRERNLKIISEAKELNRLLVDSKIKPIFLKGTANLIAGIYDDIGERMVGDIDFIFSKEDYPNAISLLKDNGYFEVEKFDYNIPNEKHYPRLKKENCIAAVEIHHEILVKKKYAKEFNYNFIKKDCQVIDEVKVLSYANKLNLSIISNQINDNGFIYKTMPLRNAYDVLILSKLTSAKLAVKSLYKLNHPLNCFLAACFEVFNFATSLEYDKNKKTESYLSSFKNQFDNLKATKNKHKRIKIYLFLKTRLEIIYRSIIYKDYRVWLFNRLTDKKWYKEKLNKLNFKK